MAGGQIAREQEVNNEYASGMELSETCSALFCSIGTGRPNTSLCPSKSVAVVFTMHHLPLKPIHVINNHRGKPLICKAMSIIGQGFRFSCIDEDATACFEKGKQAPWKACLHLCKYCQIQNTTNTGPASAKIRVPGKQQTRTIRSAWEFPLCLVDEFALIQ